VPDRHDHWIGREKGLEALHDDALTKTISLSLD
jgi:hypothetical protein